LYTGKLKKMKISRKRFQANSTQLVVESKILEIPVKAGWKEGTKVTFSREGDQNVDGTEPADVAFTIKQKAHPKYKRVKNDLVLIRNVTLKEALLGPCFEVQTLSGGTVRVDCSNDVVAPGYEKIYYGYGMPISGQPGQFGNLRIKFDVTFPSRSLTNTQKNAIRNTL